MGYSLLNGGKRFRPVLCLNIAESFGVSPQKILPWAAAIEMIHTYSLIHDDLPCMDDDDVRRGQPTNHKKFSEATALLAGDALQAEAFYIVSTQYSDFPAVALQLVRLLAQAAGAFGMVGGQVMDLAAGENNSLQSIQSIHKLKTGALIRLCSEGTAWICGLPLNKVEICRDFGAALGLAFQWQDDLLDAVGGKTEMGLSMDQIKSELNKCSQLAIDSLKKLDIHSGPLVELVTFNQNRAQ
jgi:geranylgeranyl diphosphate synthase, type II